MKMRLSRLLATTALGVPIALATVSTVTAQDIGKVAAVNPSMDGTPPQETASRSLALGAGVLQNERIETSEDGSGQLLFVDQTTLSIAPRSDIVLDKYVYDPGDESGEVEMTLTKGVLRLIGGRITKRTDGIIRTPAATIGVRGGLSLVVVDGAQTRVCHIAGEYTKVTGSTGGEIVLSRPNACAVIEVGRAAAFQGLIEADELARIYREIEGRGTGGSLVSAEAIEVVASEGVNASTKRGPFDQPVSTSGHRYAPDVVPIRAEQQLEDYGVQTFQVLTTPEPESTGSTLAAAAPEENVRDNLSGASVITTGNGRFFFTGFADVLLGSLIGRGADGSTLRVPVPGTGGSGDAVLSTRRVASNNISGGFEFTATDLAANSGLFEFFLDGTGSSTVLGSIEGAGFTDPGESFTFVEFSDGEDVPQGYGFAAFGIPTVNQGQFIPDDASVNEIQGSDDLLASIDPALVTPDLPNGVANTVEAFLVQPSPYLDSVNGTEPRMGQTPFYMIGNQGFGRVERPDTVISAGDDINPDDLVGGGKWLNGALYIGQGSSGFQESQFYAFADDIRNYDGSGPIVGGAGYESELYRFFQPESEGSLQAISNGTQNIGTLEDLDGNTMFGETNRYLVISNLHRPGLDGDRNPPGFEDDPGSQSNLEQAGSGSTRYDQNARDTDTFNALLAYDRSRDEVIANPLPLAGARVERDTGTGERSRTQVDQLDRGFLTGIAVCEGGDCGDVDRYRTAPDGSPGLTASTGSYVVRSTEFDSRSFNLDFGGHRYSDANGAFDFDTSNSVDVQFRASSGGIGDRVANAIVEGIVFATLEFEGGGETSAYIDDNRFAAQGLDVDAQVIGQSGQTTAPASFALASGGLLGTSGLEFPADTELDPQFVRWGWWSAELETPLINGGRRTDLLHLGNWVGGVRYNNVQDHIPFSGTAGFAGLAVGTMTNYTDASRRIVGGNFDLNYDFATRAGTLNLRIPDAQLNEAITVNSFGQAGDVYFGRSSDTATNTTTRVDGAFFANPSAAGVNGGPGFDGIAATGGNFESVNFNNTTVTTGIFAGDRTSFDPNGMIGQRTVSAGGGNR